MSVREEAVVIRCADDRMIGVLHRPGAPAGRGVLVVVGGPQYRVGSHRQFLIVARYLAEQGIPVLRFDYRGMGDSDGEPRTFENIGEDIEAALDEFFRQVSGMRETVIWGLCDAASAAMMYARGDPRVTGLVVLNPWMRSEVTLAKTYIRHYYFDRLRDPAFWKSVSRGGVNPLSVISGLYAMGRTALGFGGASTKNPGSSASTTGSSELTPFTERMRAGLEGFQGPVLVILSGQDLTAAEFRDEVSRSTAWREVLSRPGVEWFEIAEANHTFSRASWRDQVAARTEKWIAAW